ncbi:MULTISPECIES: hypothetical protein [Pseudomonas]|uniref:hypothetical protein n=1 Tax=Pseudomonas TaxID=286 RepID=UPI000F0343F4|nr:MULTISPECIES: hypothetical protein [Pseudomonas]MBD8614717.1 hypothetical protein [Pseudomonas putida]MBD8681599.1 hypothetical protein [Pseudomonas sp. CFBP 13719]
MLDELTLYSITSAVVFNDLEALRKIIDDLGDSTLIPLSIHSTRTGLSFPLKHAMYQIAVSHARSDTALNKLIKDIAIPIDIPGDINAPDLPEGFHRKLGLPCNDKTFKHFGKVRLDRTLAVVKRVEIELKFRRAGLIKHIRDQASPEAFCAAVCLSDPDITLDAVLSGLKDGDDRVELRETLMSRAPLVMRKMEHLCYSKVADVVRQMQLLEPHNPQRFEFWAAMFEQLHPSEGISPVADAFLHFLLHVAPLEDEQGAREVLKGLIWGVSTDNRSTAMAVFLNRLQESKLRDVQDDLVFQVTLALSAEQAIKADAGKRLPELAHAWVSNLYLEPRLLAKMLTAIIVEPLDRHNDQAWTIVQRLLDKGLVQPEGLTENLVTAYETHLTSGSSMTPDYLPKPGSKMAKFIRWNRHDISDHVGSIRHLAGF